MQPSNRSDAQQPRGALLRIRGESPVGAVARERRPDSPGGVLGVPCLERDEVVLQLAAPVCARAPLNHRDRGCRERAPRPPLSAGPRKRTVCWLRMVKSTNLPTRRSWPRSAPGAAQQPRGPWSLSVDGPIAPIASPGEDGRDSAAAHGPSSRAPSRPALVLTGQGEAAGPPGACRQE